MHYPTQVLQYGPNKQFSQLLGLDERTQSLPRAGARHPGRDRNCATTFELRGTILPDSALPNMERARDLNRDQASRAVGC